MDSNSLEYTNKLINESSPYLLQHAHNPVNWYPWCGEAFELAAKENKLILVSIGYSSCHWCHVMERESFENVETAKIMNDYFICIKVDREERPDIDQIYMSAVQLMKGNGGWPLNCFTLPDKRPVYGGTYFPPEQWRQVLIQLSGFYTLDPSKVESYASELAEGIKKAELVSIKTTKPVFTKDDCRLAFESMQKSFDNEEGGANRSPKFPMPCNYQFLLRYFAMTKNANCLKQIQLTLLKMAYGGIYDQIGGGFSRYSTDSKWKAPHFEKMLYDNAQLVSLYSDAFQLTKEPLYKDVVFETLEFIEREMTSPHGGFYSALDADSEGEEGKYYTWKKAELESALGNNFNIFSEYYNVNEFGLWENGKYILLRTKTKNEVAEHHFVSVPELEKVISDSKKILLNLRLERIRPGLDDKQLASWNGLMLRGYADAYLAFGESKFLSTAIRNAEFILSALRKSDGGLFHSYKNTKSGMNGFLEDYCFVIDAFISLYQCTFNEKWLNEAKSLADYSILHFLDNKSGMFYFTSEEDEVVVTRKTEVQDNVIPASNSAMARNLFLLSHFYDIPEYRKISSSMVHTMSEEAKSASPWYSNWAIALLDHTFPFYETVICGTEAEKFRQELNTNYIPNKIICGAVSENRNNKIPLFENRFVNGKTRVYICENKVCELPVQTAAEALRILTSIK